MRPYQSDHVAPVRGLLLSLVCGGVASIVAGAALFALDHYVHFYLIILFPIAAAFLVGLGLMAGLKAGKVRNAGLATALGLLCALGVELTYHALSYQVAFKSELAQEMTARGLDARNGQAFGTVMNGLLLKETGATGFPGYMRLEAREGISISHFGLGGLSLSGWSYWLYVLIETGIIGMMCMGVARSAATEPFNPATDRWYAPDGTVLYGTTDHADAVMQALQHGQWEVAGQHLSAVAGPAPLLELEVQRSGDPENVYLRLRSVEVVLKNKKEERKTTTLAAGLVHDTDLDAIRSAVPSAPSPQVAGPAVEGAPSDQPALSS